MSSKIPLTTPSPRAHWHGPSSVSSDPREAMGNKMMQSGMQELGGNNSASIATPEDAKPIAIDGRDEILAVAFSADGRLVLSGGREGKLRCWRVEDGKETGKPMDAGSRVRDLAVSQASQRVVSGTANGEVTVWNGTSHEKTYDFEGHGDWVNAVDISWDGTRIATGSDDGTARVWDASTGQRLLTLQHDNLVVATKFSHDGHLLATAAWNRDSVRTYDVQDGHLLADFPVRVNSLLNGSLAWASDNKRLFALSRDGNIHRLDVSTGTTLSKWLIHSTCDTRCIVLDNADTFIAASANSTISFWDTTTQRQIGPVIDNAHYVWSMAISTGCDLATSGGKNITLHNLCDILPSPYRDNMLRNREICRMRTENADPKDIIQFLCALHECSARKVADLDQQLAESECLASKREIEFRDELYALVEGHQSEVTNLEKTVRELRDQLTVSQRAAMQKEESLSDIIRTHENLRQYEVLYTSGRIYDAANSLLEIENTMNEDLRNNSIVMDLLTACAERCVSRLQAVGDEASSTGKHDDAFSAYSAALSLAPSASNTLLMSWVKVALIHRSVDEALRAATKFKPPTPRFQVYQAICTALEADGRLTEAVKCFRHTQNEPKADIDIDWRERGLWQLDFRKRSVAKLEGLGDCATDYNGAIEYYSHALSLDPTNLDNVLVKCCKARAGLLQEELVEAIKVIELDPSSYKGYKRRHASLHRMGRHREAFGAFEMMLLKLDKSTDARVRALRREYVDVTPLIQGVIEQTIRDIPRVLIDTSTGLLFDRARQATAFETLPIYHELRSSMTTSHQLDYPRIVKEVQVFYEYVMLSHKWEPGEPTFQTLENGSIYKLPASRTNDKLLGFCKLACSLRFRWAWSDTCCVNQTDRGVQQESVVAMFRWYCGSSLTIIHLLGVSSELQEFGQLWRSIWNTRGWTYQEYLASKVARFYTEDWKPYLGLDLFNHKESPLVLSEMEQAMNITAHELVTLQPGLDRAREKLFLASRRKTTREEDIAYCLFGIFNVALPVIYGEGNQAVGRLLEHVLTRSDNVTLLAWTGTSGSHHTYLPADLTVYDQIVPQHVPKPVDAGRMDCMVTALRSSLPDLLATVTLYERLYDAPSLSLVAGRLRLPGIAFPLTNVVPLSERDVYCATTPILGDIVIKTTDNLLEMKGLLFIHPWISSLLDADFAYDTPQFDLNTRALRLFVRLRQPFGALLLAALGRVQYRRVATDSLIMVRVREETTAGELLKSVRTVDVQ